MGQYAFTTAISRIVIHNIIRLKKIFFSDFPEIFAVVSVKSAVKLAEKALEDYICRA